MNETSITAPAPVKPGYKTTEFWLALAAQITGAVLASGIASESSLTMRVAGLVAMVLSGLGYTAARATAKK